MIGKYVPKTPSLAVVSGTSTPTTANMAHRPWMISLSAFLSSENGMMGDLQEKERAKSKEQKSKRAKEHKRREKGKSKGEAKKEKKEKKDRKKKKKKKKKGGRKGKKEGRKLLYQEEDGIRDGE